MGILGSSRALRGVLWVERKDLSRGGLDRHGMWMWEEIIIAMEIIIAEPLK